MPTVHYNPVPTQTLADIPTPEINPRIPSAAFGGEVAQATQGLGKAVEGVGNELFASALKMQELDNKAQVDKADTEYMKAAGLLHADFSAKQGLEAKQAFPKYMEDLEAARKAIRAGLPNAAVQKMYDSQTLGTMGRTIFNGAGHAASQLKSASIDAVQKRIETNVAVAGNSADPATVDAAKRTAIGLNQRLHELKGTPGSTSDDEFTINSSINANHIQFLAKNNKLEEAEKKFKELGQGQMTTEDFNRVQNVITTQRHSQGAANIVDNLLTANLDTDGTLKIPVAELQKQARDIATKQAPNDGVYANIVVKTLDAQLNQQMYAQRRAKQDNTQIISSAIRDGATSLDQLLKDPKAAAAYYQLPPKEQLKVPLQIYGYIRSRDRANNDEVMTQLNGMKNNDVEGFLNIDPSDPNLALSQQNIRQVQDWQEQRKKNQAQDPRVDRAMSWMRQSYGAQMEALGVYRRNERNKDDYDKLTGAVQSAYDLWLENKGKPPTNKEFNEQIAPELLRTHTEPGFFGMMLGGNKYPKFKPNTSAKEYKDFTNDLKSDFKARGLEDPTDAEVDKAFTKMQLMKLYPSKTKTTP